MSLKETGIEYIEERQMDGFGISLVYDHRKFSDILLAWIDLEAQGDRAHLAAGGVEGSCQAAQARQTVFA